MTKLTVLNSYCYKKMFDAFEKTYFLFSFPFLEPIPIWNIMSEPQHILRMFLKFWSNDMCSLIFLEIFPKIWSCIFTLRIIANYMVWHLIKPILVLLSKPYRTAALELSSKEIGTKGFEESWKNCITKTDSVLGFATGHLFVKEFQRSGGSSKHGVSLTFV